MERREFLKGLILGVTALAQPKIIFDLGANSHHYRKGFITYNNLTNTYTVHGHVTSEEFNQFRAEMFLRRKPHYYDVNESLVISHNSIFEVISASRVGHFGLTPRTESYYFYPTANPLKRLVKK